MAVHVEALFILGIAFSMTIAINIRDRCPDIPVIADFNVKRYRGIWYEIERFDNPLQANAKCISYRYCPKRTGSMGVSYGRLEQPSTNRTTTRGNLKLVDKKYPNQFKLSLEAIKNVDQSVIYTDYKKYAILYGCDNATGFEGGYILSRTREPIKRKKRLYCYLTDLGADVNTLITSDQTGCDLLCGRVC